MSERNDRMAAMLAADAPARDLAFEIAVMEKIERRRFVRSMTLNLGAAAVAALLLLLIAPQLNLIPALSARWSGGLSTLVPAFGNSVLMVMLLLAGFVAWRFRPAA